MQTRGVPEEVMFEILVKLPVRSLCRFRSVCTSWRSLISNPYFIRSHYALSETSPKRERKLLLMGSYSRSLWELLLSDEDRPDPAATVKLLNRSRKTVDYRLPRSVRGLVFRVPQRSGTDGIVILNPITEERISISVPQHFSVSGGRGGHYFFGFDPIADKHKVLYVHTVFCRLKELWVFTLGNGEKWRRIQAFNHHYFPRPVPGKRNNFHYNTDEEGDVCINGVIYYRSSDDYVVAFDLKSETFQTVKISLPGTRPLSSYDLIEFNGSVALAGNCLELGIHLLVLEDFRNQVWRLERSVVTPALQLDVDVANGESFDLACASCSGNLLVFAPRSMQGGSSFSLCFYDVRRNRLTSSKIQAPAGNAFTLGHYYVRLCDHVESLLPLKGSSTA